MHKVRTTRHTFLFYRNTLIVWTCTILLVWFIFSTPRHWFSILTALLGVSLNYFLWTTYKVVHPRKPFFRPRVPKIEADILPEKIEFLSRDGLSLCGWFIQGRRQQVIILLHGLGGWGFAMWPQARMLVRAGYSVLMPDLRAHGESQGDTITGILEVNDVLGALDYLETRPDADANQVGVLGVSLGAVVALRAARETTAIRAIVLDSMGPAKLTDHGGRPITLRRMLNYPLNCLLYYFLDFMSGMVTEEGVVDMLPSIFPRPVLFIATGQGKERHFMRIFYKAARHPKSILEVPRASRGIAFAVDGQAYRERIVAVFEQGLGKI